MIAPDSVDESCPECGPERLVVFPGTKRSVDLPDASIKHQVVCGRLTVHFDAFTPQSVQRVKSLDCTDMLNVHSASQDAGEVSIGAHVHRLEVTGRPIVPGSHVIATVGA
jgi:hypothetical protein